MEDDNELKVKGTSDTEIVNWTQDSEVAPSQTSSLVAIVLLMRPVPPVVRSMGNGDIGDALQLLQSEGDCTGAL